MRAFADQDVMTGDYRIALRSGDTFNRLPTLQALLGSVEWVPMEEGRSNPDAVMSIGKDAAQSLLDCLWQAGLRPRDIGTAGHLQATQKHLEDMRAITIGFLKKEGVL